MEPDGGDGGLNDDLSEVADEQVQRIQKEEALDRVAVTVNGVENGGHVHEQLGKDAPQVLDVPEKDEHGGENEPHPHVEQHQAADGVEQADKLPGERDAVQHAEHEEHAQGQTEVNEGLHVFGKQKQILGHVDLGEDARVAHEGGHALAGGLAEIGEHQVAAEQVGGVVFHAPAEELGEHQAHDQQHQQGGEDAPGHSQHSALVFFLEIALDQFLKEELVAQKFIEHRNGLLIAEVEVAGVDFVHDGLQLGAVPVGHDDLTDVLELVEVPDDPAAEEAVLLEGGLVDDHLHPLGLQALHDALDAGLAEVVGVGLHGQAVEPHHAGVAGGAVPALAAGAVVAGLLQDALGNEVLAGAVGVHDGADEVAGHLVEVGPELLGVLGQAVAAVAEGGVVVVVADAGVVAHPLDDLAGVQAPELGVGVQLVEEGHPEGQVGVGKELHRLGLGGVEEQDGHVLFLRPLGQQMGEGLRRPGHVPVPLRGPHDDAGGIQVVVQGAALPEKFRGEQQPLAGQLVPQRQGVAHGDGGLDDDDGVGVDGHDLADRRFHRGGVKVVFHRVVVGGGGDHHKVRVPVGRVPVGGGGEMEGLVGQIVLDLRVGQGGLLGVDLVHLGLHQVYRRHLVVLGQQYGVGQANIASTGNSDFHVIHLFLYGSSLR